MEKSKVRFPCFPKKKGQKTKILSSVSVLSVMAFVILSLALVACGLKLQQMFDGTEKKVEEELGSKRFARFFFSFF